MDQHQDENEIIDEEADLESNVNEPEPNDNEPDSNSNEPDLYDESYMTDDRTKKPPLILVVVIVLLILSVFWNKFIASYARKHNTQIEKPVKVEQPPRKLQ